MNRIVLIGNGFDLAHGLKTRYEDFLNWYWEEKGKHLSQEKSNAVTDILCSFVLNKNLIPQSWEQIFSRGIISDSPFNSIVYNRILNQAKEDKDLCQFNITSPLFDRICKQTEGHWVDIENEYYDLLKKYALDEAQDSQVESLNKQLLFLQEKLVEYLSSIELKDCLRKKEIIEKIYAPFKISDISIKGQEAIKDHIEVGLELTDMEWDWKLESFGSSCYSKGYVSEFKDSYKYNKISIEDAPIEVLLPNKILILSFNYTSTTDFYFKDFPIFTINQIHGKIEEPKSVIFGYGDELDTSYQKLRDQNNNETLRHIKSIRYLESDNYRKMLEFIESAPFQVCIMGHSCGNSDRTLLNTLFEHKNCVSIKPYYYKKEDGTDNYLELVQNISRNFTDMKLMRDRVVNKTYCEPLT